MNQQEVLRIEFPYGFKPTPAQLTRMEDFSIDGNSIDLDPDGSIGWRGRQLDLTLTEAFSITSEFSVRGSTGMARFHEGATLDLSGITAKAGNPPPVNEKCNVVVAGTNLTKMKRVINLDDYCTEGLQGMINKGWCILAICVQPDQRRPDYIMGQVDQ